MPRKMNENSSLSVLLGDLPQSDVRVFLARNYPLRQLRNLVADAAVETWNLAYKSMPTAASEALTLLGCPLNSPYNPRDIIPRTTDRKRLADFYVHLKGLKKE